MVGVEAGGTTLHRTTRCTCFSLDLESLGKIAVLNSKLPIATANEKALAVRTFAERQPGYE